MTAAGVVPLVVIPAHDEAGAIGSVVRGASSHARVLVIDDGSRDGTGARARAAGADVLRHPSRLGKAAAIRTGVAAARMRGASILVTMDGDGQHDPGDLPALLSVAAEASDAVVVGRRTGAGMAAVAVERRNAGQLASFFVSWLTGQRVEDSQCGFRAYPMAVFADVATRGDGFVFETEILIAAARAGWRLLEVPIAARARLDASSRFRPFADGAHIAGFLAPHVAAAWVRAGLRLAASVAGRSVATPRAGAPATFGAAAATLAAPAVLPLLVAQTVAARRLPDVVTPLVRALYDPARLSDPSWRRPPAPASQPLAATAP